MAHNQEKKKSIEIDTNVTGVIKLIDQELKITHMYTHALYINENRRKHESRKIFQKVESRRD